MSAPSAPCILVVDDDEDIRETLSIVLDWHGYRVIGATDGLDALDRLRAGPNPALMLLDARMPGLSGKELTERLRAEGLAQDVPVVVLSGDGSALEELAEFGPAGLLLKPVDLEDLFAIVDRLLRPVIDSHAHE